MKKYPFFVFFASLLLAGCGEVQLKQPLGMPVWYEMQGTWILSADDQQLPYQVFLLRDGSLRGFLVDWDAQQGKTKEDQLRLVVSVDDGALYANLTKEHGALPSLPVKKARPYTRCWT